MPATYLSERVRTLTESQNSDGGWGYFPGKRSWLEPTVYSLLALTSEAGSAAWEKGWLLVRSWQREDGAWQPNAQIQEAHWTTALAVTLHCIRKDYDEGFQKGVSWLLDSSGAEANWIARIVSFVRASPTGHDLKYKGWPWRPETSSWIEPTAHSLVALKKAAPHVQARALRQRVVLGEGMILRRRCSDGGWNYGARAALGVDLPSYPETTALALLGLQGNREADLGPAIDAARRMWSESRSRWSKAWLAISLAHLGVVLPETAEEQPPSRDIHLIALESMAAQSSRTQLFRPAAAA